jgi:hypothetical protein
MPATAAEAAMLADMAMAATEVDEAARTGRPSRMN